MKPRFLLYVSAHSGNKIGNVSYDNTRYRNLGCVFISLTRSLMLERIPTSLGMKWP